MLRAGPRRQCGFFAWGCGLGMEWSGVEWEGRGCWEGGSVSESEREMRWQKVDVLGVIRSQLPTSTANSRTRRADR